MIKKLRLLSGLLSVLFVGGLLLPLSVFADTFNANNIINDVVFDNINTMDASQIDAFLNKFPNSCISTNSGFDARVPSGYSPSGGFTFGNFSSAGTVLATAAQVYGINPQVLIVTLEKEQSLVTGRNAFNTYCNNGVEHKYAAAMGYGCLDSGGTFSYTGVSLYRRSGVERTSTGTTCVNSAAKAGFSQQVIRAAWLLKFGQQRSLGNINWAVIKPGWDNSDDPSTCYGGPMTQGYRKRCSSDASATYYDGYISIDATSTHMDTGATAALYWYTPHFPGNQNFFTIFNSWFGSTYVGAAAYTWSIVSQEAYLDSSRTQAFTGWISMSPGQTAYFRIKARNFGYKTWEQSVVHLGTTHGLNRSSVFADSSWLSPGRVQMLETGGVLPGGTATFEFSVTAPQQTGSYYEYFSLVADGITWLNDFGLNYPIDVVSPTQPTNNTDTGLQPGQSITPGRRLLSPDTQSALALQQDGNLVLYSNSKASWATYAFSKNVSSLNMQTDGNLVEYDSAGKALWNSGTSGNPGAYLVLQTDGNLVIYSSTNTPLWSTSTISRPDNLRRVNKYLDPGFVTYVGQTLQTANRNYRLVLQSDGNLVLYSPNRAIWASWTVGSNAAYLIMQGDGNLVLYTAQGIPVWNTHTPGKGRSTFWVQPDGNMVIYNSQGPTWTSGTPGAI